MFGYVEVIVAILCFIFLNQWGRRSKIPLFTDWPIVRMLPGLMYHKWEIFDFSTAVLKQRGGTVEFKGPWFSKMEYLITADPRNVNHVMSKNFGNYIKGEEFREVFDVMGEGIFAVDSDAWKSSRVLLHSIYKSRSFDLFLEKTIQNKMKNCLLPFLDQVWKRKLEVDLQEVFNRFNYDNACSLILGSDSQCLSIEFPHDKCERAFSETEEFLFYRNTVPKSFWKLQKWLRVGMEKKMAEASEIFDQFLYGSVASKRRELSTCTKGEMEEMQGDLLATIIKREEENTKWNDKLLRDTAYNLFSAGKDTITAGLTWFIWLVATHPSVEAKILEEIKQKIAPKPNEELNLGLNEIKSLVYLHAVICETLRLYPPVPVNRKQAENSDILPSGHHVSPNTTLLFFLYSMARSEETWGKDCLEFKPERWISEKGDIVHMPSYKFATFNAGPRTCLGKDLTFIQMKMILSQILWNYHVEVVEGHPVHHSVSIVLTMEHGLKVRVRKRGA